MKTFRLWPMSVFMLIAFALLSTACAGIRQAAQQAQQKAMTMNDLKQIGIAYHTYYSTNRKGPANADDLMKAQPEAAAPLSKVKSGEYVIIWSVNIGDAKAFEPQGLSGTVLGYEASAPTSGGAVVMADGSAREMTAAEFNAAPKAKSGGSGDVGGVKDNKDKDKKK